MTKKLTKNMRERREHPAEKPAASEQRRSVEATAPELDRRSLWVVIYSRMKQYGDLPIERTGQVIRRQYLRNDDLLLKHGYVRALEDHDDLERCPACGLIFLGNSISGPYKQHLAYARHDLAKLDLDTGLGSPDGRKHRVGDVAADPDADASDDWDLEPEGAPTMPKLEDESPRGVRVSMGNR